MPNIAVLDLDLLDLFDLDAPGGPGVVSPWAASTLDPDLVAYLSQAIGRQVYAPLKRGLKYRGPVNVSADPIVTYARIFAVRPLLLSGPTGLVEASYQVDVFGVDFDAVLVVAEQVRFALQGFRGTWGTSTVLNVVMRDQVYSWLENEDPKKVGVYRLINEFTVSYLESVRAF